MDLSVADDLLNRLHRAQNEYYAGADETELATILTRNARWSVPGDNALAGIYTGIDEVLDYMQRRRRLAGNTLRLVRRDVLVGRGDRFAALTDGVALLRGEKHSWGTVGLYEASNARIHRCWLLPLDQAAFDAIWS